MNKVELKEIGLDIGLAFAKHFYKTDYLHYGYWTDDLTVEPSNVFEAQENYANLLLEHFPKQTHRCFLTIVESAYHAASFASLNSYSPLYSHWVNFHFSRFLTRSRK